MDKLDTLAIIADHTRYKLLQLIIIESKFCDIKEAKPYEGNCLTDLNKRIGVSKSTLSHHLKLLEEHDLIIKKKKGKWTYIFPNKDVIDTILTSAQQDLEIRKDLQIEEVPIKSPLSTSSFSELLSLISNHGAKIVHKNTSKGILKNSNDVLVEITNTEHKLKVRSSKEMNALIQKLIKKYLPSLT